MFGDVLYCTCNNKDKFGIVTFYFEKNSMLDIDLRDYIYYDNTAYFFKCKVDIILSKNNEFIIGLKGLKNTILSFNMQEKKIKFFQKKKYYYNGNVELQLFIIKTIIIIYFTISLSLIYWCYYYL